ncbi:MAG: radical SAM family heme chaperone HemW [Termitinemataceae bacterium]|nr:MAG: radical SAM family heme chaperone HemW [Termitinemataceae bacterium]
MRASLYIHIPFCLQKCDYCGFYSLPLGDISPRISLMCEHQFESELNGTIEKFLNTLYNEIILQIEYFCITEIPTVYIGGGSPSILGCAYLKKLLCFINAILPNRPDEFTVELNPEFMNEEILSVCKENNVNRTSIGIQSFNEQSRLSVGRICSNDKIMHALNLINTYFPNKYSADIISGLPFSDTIVDIKTLLQHNPAHISLYDLTIEAGTPLEKKLMDKKIDMPAKEEAEDMWINCRTLLEQNGYGQYEVSNFCKENCRSIHNTRYWLMENWIGAGPSASGTIITNRNNNSKKTCGKRYSVKSDLRQYINNKRNIIIEDLNETILVKESLLMGFRYIDGPKAHLFYERFGFSIEEIIPHTIKKWRQRGLFEKRGISLTKDGLLLLNPFLNDCFAELEVCGDHT